MIVSDPLGTGWRFPPEPAGDGSLDWQSGPALVRQSILLILDTEPGERVMRPDFGCGLRQYLMEPNTPATRAAIAREVDAALRAFEPRVMVTDVDVAPTDDPAVVLVSIGYTHVRDRSTGSLRVPLGLSGPTGGG
ncbi:GPW/gp25 family protein [Micromonospora arborensis]|uniref:GPW/gp25 family protein n=1 Tax=Micromonospora arborensis TaxID=2116518 RepID=UPI0033E26099